ncbi:hypothetical protein [Streptomyces sp. NPDC047079]|uniref:hypothetical protein n=1 Tax=Streptomyces sp. NPDC047079 TaxID=3154607 RepID=UPI0033E5F10B
MRKVAAYQDRSGPYAMLRPVGGGREWQTDPATLRPATARERLSAGVTAANERTRTAGDTSRPPLPVRGCATCTELDGLREAARAEYDGSAETDANVLLGRHHNQKHRS